MSIITIKPQESTEVKYEPGKYEAVIQAVEMKQTKSLLDMLAVTLKGEFGVDSPRTITANIVDNGFGQKLLYKLFDATYLLGEENVDTDDLQGKYVGIEIKEGEPYNDKPTWNVTNFFPLDEDDSEEGVDVDVSDDWSDAE